jgi:tetratricopeptide (TPR) repeat protein
MSHFYLALNHLLRGDFESALAEAARADAVGTDIGDPRLQTYAAFAAGWIEILRGNLDAAIGRCRRSLELAPDRVSRAYASLFVAYALLEQGEHAQAGERLQPLVAEFESFGFPQWQAFAATLLGESWRLLGRLDDADAAVESGRRIAIRAGYWYAVALGCRIAGRIARDRGAATDALSAFREACDIFDRIDAAFERARTREEIETVRGRPGPEAVI